MKLPRRGSQGCTASQWHPHPHCACGAVERERGGGRCGCLEKLTLDGVGRAVPWLHKNLFSLLSMRTSSVAMTDLANFLISLMALGAFCLKELIQMRSRKQQCEHAVQALVQIDGVLASDNIGNAALLAVFLGSLGLQRNQEIKNIHHAMLGAAFCALRNKVGKAGASTLLKMINGCCGEGSAFLHRIQCHFSGLQQINS